MTREFGSGPDSFLIAVWAKSLAEAEDAIAVAAGERLKAGGLT